MLEANEAMQAGKKIAQETGVTGDPAQFVGAVGDPGVHGAVVAGMQGMGVNTPRAAAVAEATVGFAMDMHIPKVGMLVMGIISMMVAAGVPAMV